MSNSLSVTALINNLSTNSLKGKRKPDNPEETCVNIGRAWRGNPHKQKPELMTESKTD